MICGILACLTLNLFLVNTLFSVLYGFSLMGKEFIHEAVFDFSVCAYNAVFDFFVPSYNAILDLFVPVHNSVGDLFVCPYEFIIGFPACGGSL